MKNVGINELIPLGSGARIIALEPYYMEGIGKDGQGVEVYINNKIQTRSNLDQQKQLFKLEIPSNESAIINVKIKVKHGQVRIGQKDAVGYYPAMYDKIEGRLRIEQWQFVHWMQQPSLDITTELLQDGDEFEYLHLIPQSPSFLKVYLNKEKHKEEFLKNKILCPSTMEDIMIKPMYEYYSKLSAGLFNPDEITRRMIDEHA